MANIVGDWELVYVGRRPQKCDIVACSKLVSSNFEFCCSASSCIVEKWPTVASSLSIQSLVEMMRYISRLSTGVVELPDTAQVCSNMTFYSCLYLMSEKA